MSKLLAPAALPALLLLALSACATPARGGDDYTAFVYAGCSQARYDPGSQYAADVDTALSSLVNSAGYTAYANYTSPSAAATGLAAVYQCRSDLPAAVCGACVRSAASKLSSLCNTAAGAAVQLRLLRAPWERLVPGELGHNDAVQQVRRRESRRHERRGHEGCRARRARGHVAVCRGPRRQGVHRLPRRRPPATEKTRKKCWFNIFQMLVQHFLNVGSTF